MLLEESSSSASPAIWVAVFLTVILPMMTRRRNEAAVAKLMSKRKSKEEKIKMTELAKSFIGKECLVYMLNGNTYSGTITEVTDGAILLEKCSVQEALNLDFVLRIREYPKNKNGKKKSVVLD